jgi:hypothetical protein
MPRGEVHKGALAPAASPFPMPQRILDPTQNIDTIRKVIAISAR